ncbi:hypothetical protein E4191_18315 (plasmid) [Paracoccus liaowanqingii]|uniref:DUF3618 domain-containing protein n=1 Tax=Paracoccus liaowanqingii TaxID=2560053 RepID=A0A4Y5SRE9_9RHOB|nr:hypothetical protein [Paracoccus liaowanqingii]QDA36082.1 hypothetical protein E4191_18315 [Paracoccus liaowanqingii]
MKEHTGQSKSLDDLERDAERDRAALAGSVAELQGRLGGDGGGLSGFVSNRARGYVEERRSAAVEGAWRRMEDHPLQTVAMAAVVAYPVVRIVTKIPAPILLLGAGVALTGRGGSGQFNAGQSEEHEKSRTMIAPGAVETTSVPENELTELEVSTPVSARTSVGATNLTSSGLKASAGHTRSDTLHRVRDGATEAGRAGGKTMVAAIRRNPAIAGGVSLAIGAALAAILPRTRAEGRTLGEAAKDVRERARSLSAEGVEAGRQAVEAAIDAAADEGEEQGLTGKDARNTIREGADKVGKTIHSAADNAKDAIEGATGRASDGKSESKSS